MGTSGPAKAGPFTLLMGPLPLVNAPADHIFIGRPIRRPCFGRSLGALFGTYPIQSMRAQSLVRRAKIENSARAASRRRQAEADEPNNVWVGD